MKQVLISEKIVRCGKAKGYKLLALLLMVMIVISGLSGCKKKVEPSVESSAEESVEEEPAEEVANEATQESENESEGVNELDEDGYYYSKDEVALYIHLYGHLPDNYMTKKEAKKLGWSGGSLEKFAPGMVIGGDRYGNYEGNLPDGKNYTECDIDTYQKKKRGAKRIVFSDDGYIYYTKDHYETFELLYEPD